MLKFYRKDRKSPKVKPNDRIKGMKKKYERSKEQKIDWRNLPIDPLDDDTKIQ